MFWPSLDARTSRRPSSFFAQAVVAPAWSYSDVGTQASKLLSAENIDALKSRAEVEVAARWSDVTIKLEKNRQSPSLQKKQKQRLAKELAKELKKQQQQQQKKEARAQQKQQKQAEKQPKRRLYQDEPQVTPGAEPKRARTRGPREGGI
jgi:hypothetical protein